MNITCNHCQKPVEEINLKQAKIIQSAEFIEKIVDVVLACPHCSQEYSVFVPTWDLQPLETACM
ncbi:hypothetical protein L7750_01235 [Xenorhabdus bovienii]|uniref:hypothetical protein n=1 Tax=Xenorhabdus bovienii TaxID=40576 RepID=UPI001EE14033|nr:hypothetical protein [Xenorhabdus bovienii]MCG3469061.1 hypothetical protein [Xenorhabdus bovienii]